MKIEVLEKVGKMLEFPGHKDISIRLEQQIIPTPVIDSHISSGSIASSEATGDTTSSYGSRDEYADVALFAPPNGFFPPQGTIYTVPVMNMQGYVPYSLEGVQYNSPVIDYNFVNQPCIGSLSPGMQYHTNDYGGYMYGPPLYPFPPQPYYQQASGGQYLLAPPNLAAGGVVLLEPQDPPGLVISTGLSSTNAYAGGLPVAGFQMPMVPPSVNCEKGAVPVAVTYVPSRTLRASAPAWIDPSAKPLDLQKQGKPAETRQGVPFPRSSADSVQSRMPLSLNPPVASSTTTKSAPLLSDIPARLSTSKAPDTGVTPVDTNTRLKGSLKDDGLPQTNGNGCLTSQHESSKFQPEENKDVWASKVGVQQLVPVLKSLKVSCESPKKDEDTPLPQGQYNVNDFVTKYDDAKHFIIKSYSEENVHRSIQYNVWASTPNGNKKLDEAYRDAQCRAAGKPTGCPVFLFFSVNGSRQFCGLAEMIGPVDYSRTMEFWEQHKWSGSFPVKWHIIKDVPNSQLRRIILENNENKPVTNSRDTQDVNFHQGLEMLNIFKGYPLRTSILDDLPYFMSSQNLVQEVKPLQWTPQCFPRIGEQIAKERDETDMRLKTAKLESNSPNTLDNGPTLKEPNCLEKCDAKPLLGKGSEKTIQDAKVDKEKFKREKENVKFPSKEERVMV